MSILGEMRSKVFWLLDGCKGGYIKQAYDDIKKMDETDSCDSRIKAYQDKVLYDLMKKACTETEFYRQYKGKAFDEFPIINKNTIRQNQENFLSNKYVKDNLIKMSTSGSTGTPFICYQNAGKKKRVNAEIIYYSEKVGYKLGENLSYIRTIVKQNKKSGWKQFVQNQTLINCMSLDDNGVKVMLDTIVKKSKYGKVTLLGYGSTYTAIKNYAKKCNIKCMEDAHVTGIISGSDMLFDETRDAISSLFQGVPVVSRYSNEENGVLGQDEGISNVFTLNEADYIVEICDNNGKPIDDGRLGHIVVTDLYNYAMPMIRYDTGDVGAINTFEINGRKKRCICNFSGRSVDVIYDTKGAALSPHVITNFMWSYPDVNQYQIIQKGKKSYIARMNLPDNFTKQEELEKLLYQLLGQDAELKIEMVNEIPVLASGKRRYVINEMR